MHLHRIIVLGLFGPNHVQLPTAQSLQRMLRGVLGEEARCS